MTLTLTIKQHGKKPKIATTHVADLHLDDLRKILAAEQTLNAIPGADLRVHLEVSE